MNPRSSRCLAGSSGWVRRVGRHLIRQHRELLVERIAQVGSHLLSDASQEPTKACVTIEIFDTDERLHAGWAHVSYAFQAPG